MKKFTVLMIIVSFMLCFSISPAAASDEDAIMQLMSDYFKAWNTNDNKLMASVHWKSPDFSFFGPNKDTSFFIKGWDETAELFKTTFESPIGTYTLTYHDPQVLMLENNVALVTLYTIWNINNTDTNVQEIQQIRGTQVVKKLNGKWHIVHVHWSILPTE